MERCAGIDVGKRELAVALVVGPADKDGEVTTRAFGTTVPELEKLRQWLIVLFTKERAAPAWRWRARDRTGSQ